MWPSDRKGEASATQRNVDEGETQKKPAPKKVTLKTEVAILGAATQKRPDNPGSKGSFPSRDTSASEEENRDERPRQVIAVSASKGPAAFFNLARKFLVTDEICDLSALEGAIVAAVDAAHLLERSKLATIIKVNTSYVTVEPKRKKQPPTESTPKAPPTPVTEEKGRTRELRRARIVITVQRTEHYKRWLKENPLQAVIAADEGDDAPESVPS